MYGSSTERGKAVSFLDLPGATYRECVVEGRRGRCGEHRQPIVRYSTFIPLLSRYQIAAPGPRLSHPVPLPVLLHIAPHLFAQPAQHVAGAPGRICFPGDAQSEAVRGSAELVVLSLQAGQDGPVGARSTGVQVPRNLLLSLGCSGRRTGFEEALDRELGRAGS
jgi:hypothetical protein